LGVAHGIDVSESLKKAEKLTFGYPIYYTCTMLLMEVEKPTNEQFHSIPQLVQKHTKY